MFSSQVNPLSTRNPRRRQRTGSDDSVALRPNHKRPRRAGLSTDTFRPPSSKDVNGYIQHPDSPSQANGHTHDTRSQREVGLDTATLPIRHRGSKRGERDKRANRSDGSIELVSLCVPVPSTLISLFVLPDQERKLRCDPTPDNSG